LSALRVIYDVRGAQTSFHPERGLPRYVINHLRGLADSRELSSLQALVDPGRPVPDAITGTVGSRGILPFEALDAGEPSEEPLVHHIGSVFEFDWTHRQLLPPALAGTNVVRAVTLFDAVPLVCQRTFAHWTHDAWYERLCKYRADVVRIADLALCISDFAAQEGMRHYGLDKRRVRVIGAAAPEEAVGAASGASDREAVPGVQSPFVLYTGGAEHPRKNLFRLIRGFAALPRDLLARHQLVIASRLDEPVRHLLAAAARQAGIAERVLLTGYVSNAGIRELYRDCACFVYPSLYEGFGFPLVEAMGHGAPAIASNTAASREVIGDPRALFDGGDESRIAGLLSQVLSEEAFAASLRANGKSRAARFRWSQVADRTVAAYREFLADRDVSRFQAAS
jgi:glycosyltransferase involved in cell wall biosynthesis